MAGTENRPNSFDLLLSPFTSDEAGTLDYDCRMYFAKVCQQGQSAQLAPGRVVCRHSPVARLWRRDSSVGRGYQGEENPLPHR